MQDKTIGVFAKLAGVGIETVRYYQRFGLLAVPERQENFGTKKIRHYDDNQLRRLRFILAAKKAGFTLKEIKELLDCDATNDKERVRHLAQQRIEKLVLKITELSHARDALAQLITQCKEDEHVICPIIATFDKTP